MKLGDYLDEQNLTPRDFAKDIEMHYSNIYNIIRGEDLLLSTAFRIFTATKGKVGWLDMLPERPRTRRKKKESDEGSKKSQNEQEKQ